MSVCHHCKKEIIPFEGSDDLFIHANNKIYCYPNDNESPMVEPLEEKQ